MKKILSSPLLTAILAFAIGIIMFIVFGKASGIEGMMIYAQLIAWLHVIVGITWIGLLYYFNFVQVPAVGQALADEGGPGPAGINKYVAPKALFWFRWAALATWITGLSALENIHGTAGSGVIAAFTFQQGFVLIGVGAWLGTIMLFNVWMIIWPNQRKILGLNPEAASADEIAKAKVWALMASRTNTVLSIPLLFAMTGFGHGLAI